MGLARGKVLKDQSSPRPEPDFPPPFHSWGRLKLHPKNFIVITLCLCHISRMRSYLTGLHLKNPPRLCDYGVKKLRFPALVKQSRNFFTQLHTTMEGSFSAALYWRTLPHCGRLVQSCIAPLHADVICVCVPPLSTMVSNFQPLSHFCTQARGPCRSFMCHASRGS